MKPRNTAILALVVAVVGALVWFFEIRGAEKRAEAEAAKKRVFPGLEAAQIAVLTLRTSDAASARLERVEGAWRLTQPLDFPADESVAEGLASALATLESEAIFEDPAPLADYGLEGEPALRFDGDGGSRELRIGDKSPVGGNTYVATAESRPVYAVATWRTSALGKSLLDLRDKRVLAFDREAVDGIRVAWPGGAVRLARSDGKWRMLEPLESAADEEAVDDLLSDLSYLRASGFIDEPPADPAAVGLADPALTVELSGPAPKEGATPLQLALAIGTPLPEKERAVRGSGAGVLYRIPEDRIDDFPRRVGAWRFRDLSHFAGSDAERLEIVFHDEAAAQSVLIRGRHADDGWTTEPEPMDGTRASTLISTLARLRAADVAADAPAPAELEALGLVPPRAVLRVRGAAEEGEGPLLAEVQIGVADPERGIAARRGDAPTVYWLDYDLAEELPVSLDAFRNRFKPEAPPAAEAGAALPVPDAPPHGFEEFEGFAEPGAAE